MKFILIGLFVFSAQAQAMLNCVPEGGQLVVNNTLYLSYVLEADSESPEFLVLRKEYQDDVHASFVGHRLYRQAFVWREEEKIFGLAYAVENSRLLVLGELITEPTSSGKVLARAMIGASFEMGTSPLSGLADVNETEVPIWTCQLDINELRKLVPPAEPEETE